MKFSLILASYGRQAELVPCLDALCLQQASDFEVLLMDQNPDDRLQPLVSRYRQQGLILRHERLPRPGLAAARNVGLSLAQGDIVAFPDDDCWYEAQTLTAVQQAFLAEPELDGLVADWPEQTAGGGNAFAVNGERLALVAWRDFRGGAASSITLFMKRRLLCELQGFDERFGVGQWYGAAEETDLLLRALATGAAIRRLPSARVHHAFAPTPSAGGCARRQCQALRARARGTGALYAKHDLAARTILRGLFAPWLKPLLRLQFGQPLRAGWAVALGRFEGMRRWQQEASRP